jgi:hypothetical protein
MGVPVSKKEKADEEFVALYVEFRTGLSEFLPPKQLKRFERELAKDSKVIDDVLEGVGNHEAGFRLTDLIVYRNRDEPDFDAKVNEALDAYSRFLEIVELRTLLWGFHGRYKGITKKFNANRRHIRKLIAAKVKTIEAAEPAPEVDVEAATEPREIVAPPAVTAAPAP